MAVILLRLIALLAVLLIAWAVPELARRLGVVDPAKAFWLAVATPLVGAHFISGGHNDALMVAGVLTGLVLALRGRFAIACLVLALAAMVKVTALVVVPFIALLWAARRVELEPGAEALRWAGIVRAGVLAVIATAAPVLVVSLVSRLGFAWLNPASTPGKNEQWTSLPTGLGMAVGAAGHLLGHEEWRDAGISVARTLALGVMVLVLVLLWLTTARQARDQVRVVRAAGLALLFVVVLAPAFLGWYYLWFLPILAVTVSPETRRPVITGLAVIATILCFAQLPDGYSLGLTTTVIGVPIVLVVTALLVRAAWRWARRTDWRHLLVLAGPGVEPSMTGRPD
ncbi:MAG: polyprenol phosphomannose-dependent alpha 1,6 mannosyltransferase MptB, partial [Micrococcales bacterium]|nr:polyprenol phosphomannose-dependent alpha 1,6 mannosyltransferase MptB [Micrococcales bacterium]